MEYTESGERRPILPQPGIAGSILALFSSQLVSLALNFLTRVVLARLLAPADFGLFALALFVLAITLSLQDFGFSSHLVREEERLFGNALLLQVGASLFLMGGLFLSRDLFTSLNPGLPALLPLLSVVLFSEAFTNVFLALLRKKLLFREAVLPEVFSLGVFSSGSLLLAFLGWGVWSLVVAHVLGSYAKALLLWGRVRRIPAFSFTLVHTARLIRGSIYFFLIGLTGLLLLDLDKAILGIFLPAHDVGNYVMAFSLVYLPCRLIESPLRQVAYPAFAQAAGDKERLHETYRNFTLLSLALELPLYLFIAANAEIIVLLLYGRQWLPIVPLIFWMSFLPLVDPFSKFGNQLLQGTGKESIQYYASIPYLLFFAGASYVLTQWRGVSGMILANYLQVGGWAITYFYLKTVGGGARLLRELLVIYSLSCGLFILTHTLIVPSRTGSLILSALLLLLLWATLLLYSRPTFLRLPRLRLMRFLVTRGGPR